MWTAEPGGRPAFFERRFRHSLTAEWFHALIFIYEAELETGIQDFSAIGCAEEAEQHIVEIKDPSQHIKWHPLADLDLTTCHPMVRPYLAARRNPGFRAVAS